MATSPKVPKIREGYGPKLKAPRERVTLPAVNPHRPGYTLPLAGGAAEGYGLIPTAPSKTGYTSVEDVLGGRKMSLPSVVGPQDQETAVTFQQLSPDGKWHFIAEYPDMRSAAVGFLDLGLDHRLHAPVRAVHGEAVTPLNEGAKALDVRTLYGASR